ncbi:MAG: chorismate--pyruvate lyase family protein [Pseudomonadota bacterium]
MIHWQRALHERTPWRPWLTDQGSLTQRLRDRFPEVRVVRLREAIATPNPDEWSALALRFGQRALVREVLLTSAAIPLVYAHTVIPLACLRGPWHALTRLGNRSLGSALFSDPKVARMPLQYARLDHRHPLYQFAARHLDPAPASLWARRSLFGLAGHRLMVSEVFLPPGLP